MHEYFIHTQFSRRQLLATLQESPHFVAPEVALLTAESDHIPTAVDVWSLVQTPPPSDAIATTPFHATPNVIAFASMPFDSIIYLHACM